MAAAAAPPTDEVPITLDQAPPPRLLGLFDQTALWANLGVSLLLLMSAGFIMDGLSLAGAFVVIVLGTVIGNALLGLAAVAGAETGAPSMVLLRGMFGRRGSWVPTALNILQNIGWGVFEVIIISEAAARLTDDSLKPVFVIAAAAAATLMAIRPLGVVRGWLKKVAVWAVLVSTAYLFVRILQKPLPSLTAGGWSGFWPGLDLVLALPVSWMPLAADYSRHSRSARDAFGGAFLGYSAAMLAFFSLGVLAYSAFALQAQPGEEVDVLASILAVPIGAVALLILVFDEVDEAFANIYSTVVSAQNVQPRLDRRIGAVAVGAVVAVLGLVLEISDYESFLFLLGSVFLPLFGAFVVDYFVFRRRDWDTSDSARPRWEMLLPWAAGFAVYHLTAPGLFDWWAEFWDVWTAPSWASASILSFATAAAGAFAIGRLRRV